MQDGRNKTALVFGGSRGIGAATVRRLARDGYRVAFTYVSRDDLANATVETVRATGSEAIAIRADSAERDQIVAAVDAAAGRYGAIDVVVVNAGLYRSATIDAVSVDDLDRMLAVNVRGVYLSIQATLPRLRAGARVITIGSNVAIRSEFAGSSVYQMTKAAVAAMAKGIALDLAPRGITVNNIQPGPVDTDINAGRLEMLADLSPLKRVAHADEIAGLVAYLVRDEAGYITGASITIDGGFTL